MATLDSQPVAGRGREGGDRREFFRAVGRYAAVGALGGLTLLAARRSQAGCRRPFVCGQCPAYAGCDLPKASEYRTSSGPDAEGVVSDRPTSGPTAEKGEP